MRDDVELPQQAFEGQPVGVFGAREHHFQGEDLLIRLVLGVRAAGLERLQRRHRLAEPLAERRHVERRAGFRPAQDVAVRGHAACRRAEVGDLQAEGQGADEGGIGLRHPPVEPGLPGVFQHALAGDLGRDGEAGIEPGLERPLAQQVGGEGVDRGHGRALDVGRGGDEALAVHLVGGRLERALDLLAEAQLQLPGRLLRERDRHDAVERGAAGADQGQDAADQHRRLARPRAGFEQEGGVEVADDAVADGLVGRRARHWMSRRRLNAASRGSADLRCARSSRNGPHTGW